MPQSLVNNGYDRVTSTLEALHYSDQNQPARQVPLRQSAPDSNQVNRVITTTGQLENSLTADGMLGNSPSQIVNMSPAMHKHRVSKPGQRFGAKKRSWVWSWFIQDQDDPNIATCEQCLKVVRRLPSDKGSPKKLSEHLKTHKIYKDSITPKKDQHTFVNESPNSNGRLALVPTDGEAVQNSYLTDTTGASDVLFERYSQMKFHKAIMKFLTENKLPLTVVKTRSFRQLIYTLRPESLTDLNDLNSLYLSLLQVIRNEDRDPEAEDQQGKTIYDIL